MIIIMSHNNNDDYNGDDEDGDYDGDDSDDGGEYQYTSHIRYITPKNNHDNESDNAPK